jgi:predicted membrane channel-forming protein YqfA (hemolysin III family)
MFQLVTATMSTFQFMFHDYEQIRQIYAYSFLILSFSTIILSMFDFFISSKFNLFLMFSYAALFLISFLSSIHWIAIAKLDEVESMSAYILLGFLFIFIGFAIFLAKFPECIIQHKFIDYYFNSHIIWHICVVGTAVCYYVMLNKYFTIVMVED